MLVHVRVLVLYSTTSARKLSISTPVPEGVFHEDEEECGRYEDTTVPLCIVHTVKVGVKPLFIYLFIHSHDNISHTRHRQVKRARLDFPDVVAGTSQALATQKERSVPR